MKLSEAMRAGCKIAPRKLRGSYLSASKKSACAFGAAMLGSGNESSVIAGDDFSKIFGYDPLMQLIHPVDGFNVSVRDVVTDLNDYCGWRREDIADYLAENGL